MSLESETKRRKISETPPTWDDESPSQTFSPVQSNSSESDANTPIDWIPASVSKSALIASTTYHSEIPKVIQENPKSEVVLGIDEAGRGPVLGPMVYGLAYALKDQKLPGFADSKVLKDLKRRDLHERIDSFNVGWATRTMTARDISAGMLRSSLGEGAYNLNAQAHDTTIQLIKEVISSGVNVTEIYVDTVGPPAKYQEKLKSFFSGIDITVAKKADSIYPIVSAASVVAKVTRDMNLELYTSDYLNNQNVGSGYPSDPNTSKWLNSNVDPVFGWSGIVRFSWQTSKDSLKKNGGVDVILEEEMMADQMDVGSYFQNSNKNADSKSKRSPTSKSSFNASYYVVDGDI